MVRGHVVSEPHDIGRVILVRDAANSVTLGQVS